MTKVSRIEPDPNAKAAPGPGPADDPASTEARNAPSRPDDAADTKPPRRKTKAIRRLLMPAVPVALVVVGGYFYLSGGRYATTENAHLHEGRITIASDLSGRVTEVEIADNQAVHEGDLLFALDTQPYELARAEAEIAVAQARIKVEQMKTAYRQARAQQDAARVALEYKQRQLDRQKALAERGVATSANLDSAEYDRQEAHEALAAARQATASAAAALGGDPDIATDDHPAVRAARAALDRAEYNLSLATVRAPADGVIYKADDFRNGAFVSAGSALFSLVETGDIWIDANFKEDQLADIRPGQTAEVSFDMLPGQTFEATIDAIGAGTGAEFSILPAQNATGNWVKVTQRVPVRLRLDPGADVSRLVSGASARVTVDTRASREIFGHDLSFLN